MSLDTSKTQYNSPRYQITYEGARTVYRHIEKASVEIMVRDISEE